MKADVATFIGLLALTTLTLVLSFVPLGAAATPTAMVIAATKASLVLVFFMHLGEHGVASWIALVVSVLLAGVFIGISVLDVASRIVVATGAHV